MQKLTIQTGSYEVNCTILHDGDSAYVVDPGAEAERIIALLEERKLAAKAILLTHAHFDHIGAVPALQARYPGLPVYVGAGDMAMFGHPFNQLPPEYPLVARPENLRDAHELEGFEAIDTPGHTPGGVCWHLAADRLLLSGDTLFAGSAGRTDFPGGSMSRLMESLAKLAALPDDTEVIPGHGPFTTIGREKATNVFMRADA